MELRWADQDAYGHINNVAYARFLEEARVRVFFTGDTREPTGLEGLFRDDTPDGQKMVVAKQEVEFLRSLEYSPAPITVELWFGKVGGSSLDVHSEIVANTPERTVFVRGITTAVVVDGTTMRPRRLTEAARTAVEPWIDTPLALGRRN